MYPEFVRHNTIVVAVAKEDESLDDHAKMIAKLGAKPPFELVADLATQRPGKSGETGRHLPEADLITGYLIDETGKVAQVFPMCTQYRGSWRAILSSLDAQPTTEQSSEAIPDITFASKRAGGTKLYTSSVDGDKVQRIGSGSSDYAAAWSPDGNSLAFNSHRNGGWKIWVIDKPGAKARRLTRTKTAGFNYEYFPAWSPDGKRLAFEKWNNQAKNFEIHVVARNGTQERNLTRSAGHDRQPSWSPDGTQLLFTSKRDGNNELYLMNADGSNPLNITRNKATDYAGAWSPDGKRILFHSNRSGKYRTYIMNRDGTEAQLLKSFSAADHRQGWTSEDSNSKSIPYNVLRGTQNIWSPDGRYVLLTSVRDGNEEIYLVELATGDRKRLTNHGSRDFLATFRPAPKAPHPGPDSRDRKAKSASRSADDKR